jgi:phenylacetate-CoA ligase
LSFIQDKLYPRLPVFAQNIGISAFGYQWYKRRFGGIYQQEYDACKQRESYSVDQWNTYQTIQLRKLLVHAYNNVPYYKGIIDKAGFNETQLAQFDISQLSKLPLLEKQTLRIKGKTELLSAEKEKGGTFFSSSGSTGTPVNILFSHAMHQRASALYEARVRNWAGVSRFDPRGMIGGRRIIPDGESRPPYYRYNFVEKQLYFSAYHISKQTAPDYAAGLLKYKTQYMVGYAMSNYILAKFIKEAGVQPPQMKAVLTSSEKLTPVMRSLLSEVYQCKVFDGWSGVENCGLISENEYGQLLVSPDSAIIEVLKPDGTPANTGEEGELVCTGFFNYDQPLIRYRIGDVVKLSADQKNKCGRSFPVVDEIVGRVEDVVIGKDGREMVRFHGIFVNLPNVIKGQVVQEEIDRFTINVMTNGLSAEERSLISSRMISQLGEIKLTINELADIPVGSNGKFRAVISKVKT